MGYFKINKAWQELRDASGAKKNTIAGTKFIGKCIYNASRYTVSEIVPEVFDALGKQFERKAREIESGKFPGNGATQKNAESFKGMAKGLSQSAHSLRDVFQPAWRRRCKECDFVWKEEDDKTDEFGELICPLCLHKSIEIYQLGVQDD